MNNVHDQWLNKCEDIELYALLPVVGMVSFESLSFKNQEKISGYSEALDVLGTRVALPDKYVSRK